MDKDLHFKAHPDTHNDSRIYLNCIEIKPYIVSVFGLVFSSVVGTSSDISGYKILIL